MSFFKDQSEFPNPDQPPLPEEELKVLDKVANKVIQWKMGVPAIVFLESVKPLNYISSQVMVFFEPMIQSVFNFKDYNTFQSALEKRESIEILLQKIEALDAVAHERDKRVRKWLKQEKKNWKWYQRWLGVFPPRVEPPEEVINPPRAVDGEKTAE